MGFIFEIAGRQKPVWFHSASPNDFQTKKSHREIFPDQLLSSGFQPYCLNFDERTIYFIKIPQNVGVTRAPFIYYEQYLKGLELAVLSWQEIENFKFESSGLRHIFIYSVPRSGSTLLIKLLSAPKNVAGLSEPDVFTNLSEFLEKNSTDLKGEVRFLTRFLVEYWSRCTPSGTQNVVYKFRSRCVRLAKLLYETHPDSLALFSYRNLEPAVLSGVDNFGETTEPSGDVVRREVEDKVAEWLSGISRYQKLKRGGLPIFAVKYEVLLQDPHGVLGTLFRRLGLDEGQLGSALDQLQTNSQQGTPIRRQGGGLSPELLRQIHGALNLAVFDLEPDFREIVLPSSCLART